MFDKNTLSQLTKLKEDIVASKDIAEGVVVGANGRFGFVKLDDGRTAFLNPEKMQRVLPGDRVRAEIVKNNKDQLEAELEHLIESNTSRFVGRYRIKGNNHFVQAQGQTPGRWLFVPPQFRKKCSEDDYVLAELNKHPYQDGKASVKIVARIGATGDDFLHHSLVIAQFGLHRSWSKDAQKQAEEIAQSLSLDDREDFTHLPFVTIDSASTRDMDDAVYVEPTDTGWQLWVAIADPGHFIQPGSALAKAARGFGQSVYLPGRPLPMLPETLATETFSLVADSPKPALIARMDIDSAGEVKHYEFKYGKIQSQHKLSYQDVGRFLDGDDSALPECGEAIKASLQQGLQLARARLQYRQAHHLVYEEQPDFDLHINKAGAIEGFQRRERNNAHRFVEEAMLCTNLCAGDLLAKHNTGVFAAHLGFRPERIGEVKAVLREDLGEDFNSDNIDQLEGHIELVRMLQQSEQHSHLLAPLKRMMQSTEIAVGAKPHFSMGAPYYATITSPIRRYVDLCNHWSIQQILGQQKTQHMPEKVLGQLKETLSNARQASRQLEQTLVAHYLASNLGLSGEGVIRIVTQQGFGVKLLDSGFEGFVQIPKKTAKTFDAKRMTLTVGEHCFALDGIVEVKVTAVDLEKRRVKMELTQKLETPAEVDTAATADADAS